MKKHFQFLITFVLLIYSIDSKSQEPEKLHRGEFASCGHNYNITTGFSHTKYNSFELSFGRSYNARWNAILEETFSLSEIGMEVLFFDQNKHYFAPKISCELIMFKIICLSRLNLLYYIEPNNSGSLKYRHEIGLSYRGFININYSYTFGLTNPNFLRSGSGINIQLNIPLGKRKRDSIC